LNVTVPVALLLKTLTATFSPGPDVGFADSARTPPVSVTFTVWVAVHVTPVVVLPKVNLSVAVPDPWPWAVSTTRPTLLVVSVASNPVFVTVSVAGETNRSPLGAV